MKYQKKIFWWLAVLICAGLILVNGKYLLDYMQDSGENKETYQKIEEIGFSADAAEEEHSETEDAAAVTEEEVSAADLNYEALLHLNEDCIGWIQIEDTVINYPIVQTDNNDFYLTHDFEKEEASCGCIFMDSRNDPDAGIEHLILYGHHMKDGSMFGELKEYKDPEFCQNHPEIILYLKNQSYSYEIADVFVVSANQSEEYYSYLHQSTREQQLEYLDQKMSDCRLYDTGITIGDEDELLSLSTCEYTKKNGRMIILARRKES